MNIIDKLQLPKENITYKLQLPGERACPRSTIINSQDVNTFLKQTRGKRETERLGKIIKNSKKIYIGKK
jgi:hypothetical protein